jgi:hypothetical protein
MTNDWDKAWKLRLKINKTKKNFIESSPAKIKGR